MTGGVAEAVSLVLMAVCLGTVVRRPQGTLAGLVAVAAAAFLIAAGAVSIEDARHTIGDLTSTIVFLAAILVLGHLADDAGVFTYLAALAARGSGGHSRRLLALVVVLASAVTATLTLDATVVLLTPVVVASARHLRVPARPHAYACVQLANAGSLLLPVSNLTNLLAFHASRLSFGRFAAVMAMPWLAATAMEWIGLRLFFRRDLVTPPAAVETPPPAPLYALGVLTVTMAAFGATSAVGIAPAWAAFCGVALLGLPRLRHRETTLARMVREANVGFCVFVFGLAVVVDSVAEHGLGSALDHVVPDGSSLGALLGLAALAAVLANVMNNLPATLVLLPLVGGTPLHVLAVLVGVNVGPNLTFVGSLANMLWRRALTVELRVSAREFHLYGLLTVPVILVVTTALVWSGGHVLALR